MIEYAGWLGSMCLAVCGIPQAVTCYKQGHSDGISPTFLWLWVAGEVFASCYILATHNWPLIINYAVNTVVVGIILKYKYFPRSI